MKKIVIMAVCGILSGCALLPESEEVKMLRMQQEHEREMKKLEMREKQTADERLQDDIMQGIGKFLNGVSKGISK